MSTLHFFRPRTKVVFSLLFLLSASLTGCSVIKGGPDATTEAYRELGKWQDKAKDMTGEEGYVETRRRVNTWIEAKAKEVEISGGLLFHQVDLSRPKDLTKRVNKFLQTPRFGLENLLEFLIDQYKNGRVAEAGAVSAGLRDYLWPEPQDQ